MKKKVLLAIVMVSLMLSTMPSLILPTPTIHAQLPECGGFTRAELEEAINVRGCAEIQYWLCLVTDEAFGKAEYAKCEHPQCPAGLLEKQLAGALILGAHDCYPDVIPEKCPGIKCLPGAKTTEEVLDSDGDGVADDKDKCPDTPPGTEVDEEGCPVEIAILVSTDKPSYTLERFC